MTDLLHFAWNQDVNRIIEGCRKIVKYQENILYDRNFRLPKTSDTYSALLSINDHIVSGNQRFRRKEAIDWLPQDLQNIDPSVINRHLNWQIKIHNLRREEHFNDYSLRPGKYGKNNGEILSGPKKFYSQSGFILYLRKLVCQITSRVVIYTVLRQSKILERFLKICEYKTLLAVKNTDVDDMIKQTRAIMSFPESAFNNEKYLSSKNSSTSEKQEENSSHRF